ncbi:MAG: DUF1127 domain-containing protein [Rhizobiaceae bacterium]|nr:DUF1127 domain-containing protein [Rhizobiaceae bacterium]
MAIDLVTAPHPRRNSWLTSILGFVSEERERRQALKELEALTDQRLLDIGVERNDIAARVDSEMAKINLQRLGRMGLC